MSEAITIAVPESLSPASLAEVQAELAAAGDAILVLRGGREVFCAGLALEAVRETSPDAAMDQLVAFLLALRAHPHPTIAAVEGAASGGGVGLAAACDIVIAEAGARFGLPEVLLGLTPAVITPLLLERMPPQKARLMMLDGEARDAADAAAFGLVDTVCETGALNRTVTRLCRTLARGEPDARAGAKRLTTSPDLAARLADGAAETRSRLSRAMTRARIAAFIEGRAPWHAQLDH